MRLIKMFSLAAIAAVAAMAFLGASSASAGSSLLCTKNTASLTPSAAECVAPTTVHYVNVNEKGEPAKGTLLNSTLNVTCNSLLSGKVTSAGLVTSGPVTISVAASELVYSSCTFGCTVTVIKGGTLLVLKTAAELADVTGHDFEVEVNCFGFFDCFYSAAGLVGHGLGATVAGTGGFGHVTYNGNKVTLVKGSGCPAEAKLDALYRSLTPLYIRA